RSGVPEGGRAALKNAGSDGPARAPGGSAECRFQERAVTAGTRPCRAASREVFDQARILSSPSSRQANGERILAGALGAFNAFLGVGYEGGRRSSPATTGASTRSTPRSGGRLPERTLSVGSNQKRAQTRMRFK